MRLLAIETSTVACSAALLIARPDAAESTEGIRERFEVAPQRHAELILPMVESLMAEAGVKAIDLDAVAFGRGPGAFTGLRIAAGVVQGIAFAADLPVVPVSTLAALAHGAVGAQGVERVLAGLDARMGEVYWAEYRRDAEQGVRLHGEERVCPPGEVPLPGGEDWYGAGSAWAGYEQELRARLGAAVSRWDGDRHPRASDVAQLGSYGYRRGEAVPPEAALPVYLRDQVAKKKLKVKS